MDAKRYAEKSAQLSALATKSSAVTGASLLWYVGKGRKAILPCTGMIAETPEGLFVQVQHKGGDRVFKQITAPHFWGTLTRADGKKVVYVNGAVSAIHAPTSKAVKTAPVKAVKTAPVKAVKTAPVKFDILSVKTFALLQSKGYLKNEVTMNLFTDACARKDTAAIERVYKALSA